MKTSTVKLPDSLTEIMRTRSGAGGHSPHADDDFSEEITDDGPPPPQNDVSDMDPALEEQVLETNVDVAIDSSAFQAAVDREVARVLRQRENDAKVDAPFGTVDIALRADLPLRDQTHSRTLLSRTLLPRVNPPIVRMSSAYMSENIEQSSIRVIYPSSNEGGNSGKKNSNPINIDRFSYSNNEEWRAMHQQPPDCRCDPGVAVTSSRSHRHASSSTSVFFSSRLALTPLIPLRLSLHLSLSHRAGYSVETTSHRALFLKS